MNRLVKVLISAIFILVASCSSTPEAQFVMPALAADKVTIYAFRTSSLVGGANSDIVAVNNQFIGRLNSGTYAVYEVEPGLITVSRKGGSILGRGDKVGWGLGAVVGKVDGFRVVEEFTGQAGDVYFVRFSHGKRVDKTEALEKMSGLKNITASTR